jgi:membrane protease YdiL (CAAX protease family)
VLIGPLAEEFAFRGYGRDLIMRASGPRLALFGTAALFGIFHGMTLALPLALLGLLFGWLRERYRSLVPAFVAHALHNGLTVGLMLAWPEVLNEAYR